jgi:hypothetical protein
LKKQQNRKNGTINRTFQLVTGTKIVVIARDRHKLDGRPRHSEALPVSGRFVKPLSAGEYDTVAYDHRLLSLTPVPTPPLPFVFR